MSDTKPQAWCSYWADTHKDGICLRLRGAHEALADLMREIREAREEIERMRAVVKAAEEAEWAECDNDKGETVYYCPHCDMTKREGHDPDCFIGQALSTYRAAKEVPSPSAQS